MKLREGTKIKFRKIRENWNSFWPLEKNENCRPNCKTVKDLGLFHLDRRRLTEIHLLCEVNLVITCSTISLLAEHADIRVRGSESIVLGTCPASQHLNPKSLDLLHLPAGKLPPWVTEKTPSDAVMPSASTGRSSCSTRTWSPGFDLVIVPCLRNPKPLYLFEIPNFFLSYGSVCLTDT